MHHYSNINKKKKANQNNSTKSNMTKLMLASGKAATLAIYSSSIYGDALPAVVMGPST